jgi:AmiR/NasT family two-component response regulator
VNSVIPSKNGDRRPGSAMQNLTITVCCEPDAQMQACLRELRRTRAVVNVIWPMPTRLSADADVLICDYSVGLDQTLPWLPGDAEAALVLVLPQNGVVDDRVVAALAPHAVLQRPVPPTLARLATRTAWSQFRYEQRLRDRIRRLDENLRAIRDVERAKLMIMSEYGVEEDEAYRQLRELAMRNQLTVASVAASMVSRTLMWPPRERPPSDSDERRSIGRHR